MGCKNCRIKRGKYQAISPNKEVQAIVVNQIPQRKMQQNSYKNIIVSEIKPVENNIEVKNENNHKEEEQNNEKEITFEEEINQIKQRNIDLKKSSEENEIKIELYPDNIPKGVLEKKPIIEKLPKDMLGLSLDKEKNLAFFGANVPLLEGFYSAHCNHYPIRIKPDDIWLLIVQSFSNHVNANAEKLRHYFVDFEGKKDLGVIYPISYLKDVDNKILENFSIQINEQMQKYLGKEILNNLTPNFTTTNYDSLIISKLSIMGAFKKFFNYRMSLITCGIPYIILEGTVEDYIKIKEKAKKLSKYEFNWYIDRIIPHIDKMIEAKKGNIDNNYFKDIIQKNEASDWVAGCPCAREIKVDNITGWILDFFAYQKTYGGKPERFSTRSLKVKDFANMAGQMLIVPFTVNETITGKQYNMKYNVGFIGCDQNEKNEVIPVQGWIVSPSSIGDRESIL